MKAAYYGCETVPPKVKIERSRQKIGRIHSSLVTRRARILCGLTSTCTFQALSIIATINRKRFLCAKENMEEGSSVQSGLIFSNS